MGWLGSNGGEFIVKSAYELEVGRSHEGGWKTDLEIKGPTEGESLHVASRS